MSTLRREVSVARVVFEDVGVPSPEADAIALAAFVLGTDAAELRRRMVMGDAADAAFTDRYAGLVAERAERIPLQHLTGRAWFRHLELRVGPGVFVPRPETEVLAGLAIDAARAAGPHPVVVDLCTGSGAVALAVKDEFRGAEVHAVELVPEAHAWAVANRDRLGLDVRIELGDATTALDDLVGLVDVVVSNPPYIPVGAVPLDPEVRDHDPAEALFGGSADGLAIPLAVAARGADLARAGAVLLMEHAESQGESLPAGLRRSGAWTAIEDHLDLAGRPRVTSARRAVPADLG